MRLTAALSYHFDKMVPDRHAHFAMPFFPLALNFAMQKASSTAGTIWLGAFTGAFTGAGRASSRLMRRILGACIEALMFYVFPASLLPVTTIYAHFSSRFISVYRLHKYFTLSRAAAGAYILGSRHSSIAMLFQRGRDVVQDAAGHDEDSA